VAINPYNPLTEAEFEFENDDALRAAQTILAEVNRKLQTQELEKTKNPLATPRWLVDLGKPIRFNRNYGKWEVMFRLRVALTGLECEIETTEYKIAVLSRKTPAVANIILWLPVETDGSYSVSRFHIDPEEPNLPHVADTGACMAIGDAPAALLNKNDYYQLRNSLGRLLVVANLNSLFTNADTWPKEFKRVIPPPIRLFLRGMRSLRSLQKDYPELFIVSTTTTETEERENTTWTTNT
jgi:hypothetical protein